MQTKKIAVVGVSSNPEKYGHRIFRDMVKAGWQVWGVNRNGGEVAGRTLYQTLADVPEKVDLVVTVVPPQATEEVVQQTHKLGITEIWMQPGSESDKAVDTAKKLGMKVTSQACIMVREGLW